LFLIVENKISIYLSSIQIAAIRLIELLHGLQRTIIDEDMGEWSKRLRACVFTRDGRFKRLIYLSTYLYFAWVADDAKCILVTRVYLCVSVCVSACSSPHYHTTARTQI